MRSQDDFLKPAGDHVLPVSELTRRIKDRLEEGFSNIWVRGEVSNLRRQSSGHIYFSLKDEGSQLPCVLFSRDAVRQSFQPENGMDLMLYGDLSVYEPHGRYQLIARIAIESGAGRLQVEFERLKRQLAAEGLFDPAKKVPLPKLPLRIAVITSPSGAALRDFLRILRRRGFRGAVTVFPSRVQGKGAAEEIAAMLARAGSDGTYDLAVITRGGGSIEDLWAFNEESLARAVAACPIPVISAVGHEIDTVLTDYAADARAETPSGAAELISSLYLDACRRFEDARHALHTKVADTMADRAQHLHYLAKGLGAIAPARLIGNLGIRLDDAGNRMRAALRERLVDCRERVNRNTRSLHEHGPAVRLRMGAQNLRGLGHRLDQSARFRLKEKGQRLAAMALRLDGGSLQSGLRRGFAILRSGDGRILDTAGAVSREARIIAQLRDGEVLLRPEDT